MAAVKLSYAPTSTGFGLFAPVDPKQSFALYSDLFPSKNKSKSSAASKSSTMRPMRPVRKAESSDSESEDSDDEHYAPPPPYTPFGLVAHNANERKTSSAVQRLIAAPPPLTLWARVENFATSMRRLSGIPRSNGRSD